MMAAPWFDGLLRLSEARRDFVNIRRRSRANPDSLASHLATTARSRHFETRAAAMRPADSNFGKAA